MHFFFLVCIIKHVSEKKRRERARDPISSQAMRVLIKWLIDSKYEKEFHIFLIFNLKKYAVLIFFLICSLSKPQFGKKKNVLS